MYPRSFLVLQVFQVMHNSLPLQSSDSIDYSADDDEKAHLHGTKNVPAALEDYSLTVMLPSQRFVAP
jgi:hypothetical protein